jgi:hypothetical protein
MGCHVSRRSSYDQYARCWRLWRGGVHICVRAAHKYFSILYTEITIRSIKVLTITGLIILGIVIDLGGGPDHDRIGFRYWKNPGPFVQYDGISGAKGQFLGWWSVMTQAAFSFIGTEIVAVCQKSQNSFIAYDCHLDCCGRSEKSAS